MVFARRTTARQAFIPRETKFEDVPVLGAIIMWVCRVSGYVCWSLYLGFRPIFACIPLPGYFLFVERLGSP